MKTILSILTATALMAQPTTIDVHAHILTEETIRLLQREEPKVAPKLSDVGDQFGTVAFGFGGYAEFFWVPRISSSAVLSALSSFGSGGM